MYTIGIRVSTTKIYYSIIKSEKEIFEITKCSFLTIPQALDAPEQFAYIRTNLLAIIQEYNINLASLRIAESIAQTPSIYRMNIEGVIQELFANSTVEKYSIMQIAKMAGILSVDKGTLKKYFDGSEVFGEIDNWASFKKEERESLVVAVAADLLLGVS